MRKSFIQNQVAAMRSLLKEFGVLLLSVFLSVPLLVGVCFLSKVLAWDTAQLPGQMAFGLACMATTWLSSSAAELLLARQPK